MVLGFSIALLTIGLLLAGWIGIQTIRAIGRPLEQLNGVMAKIAQGLFNSRIAIERDDEIGIALRNVQAMQAKLGFDREVNCFEEALRRRRTQRVEQLTQAFDADVSLVLKVGGVCLN